MTSGADKIVTPAMDMNKIVALRAIHGKSATPKLTTRKPATPLKTASVTKTSVKKTTPAKTTPNKPRSARYDHGFHQIVYFNM